MGYRFEEKLLYDFYIVFLPPTFEGSFRCCVLLCWLLMVGGVSKQENERLTRRKKIQWIRTALNAVQTSTADRLKNYIKRLF
jgi:hypothetical protein